MVYSEFVGGRCCRINQRDKKMDKLQTRLNELGMILIAKNEYRVLVARDHSEYNFIIWEYNGANLKHPQYFLNGNIALKYFAE
jgi:hypothetical protein